MEQETLALGDVADQDLIARLRRLVRADRTLSARMLVHLGEMDARGLYRECACACRVEERRGIAAESCRPVSAPHSSNRT